MKKVIFAMLVSGMLFSCTNNNQSEEASTVDSTATVTETVPAEIQNEELEEVEIESTSDSVEVVETEEAVQ